MKPSEVKLAEINNCPGAQRIKQELYSLNLNPYLEIVDLPQQLAAYKTLTISFVSGFLMALGVAIRDELGGKDKSTIVHKLPV